MTVVRILIGSAALLLSLVATSAMAEPGHRSAVVVEVTTGRVLHAESANRPLPPASLTKLMTIYLLLDAVAEGSISLESRFEVSSNAAAQPATRFGFRAGERVDVATLLASLVVVSANDAATIAAEGLAGSEQRFVERMNAAARSLDMRRTWFRNASGLPADGQRTTARDVAVLARALLTRFADQRALFALREVRFDGRRYGTINAFLGSYQGADGMKTGFTCRAGFNLVASVRRDGRHLLGVVLGAASRGQRAAGMRRLLDAALSGDVGVSDSLTLTLSSLSSATNQGASLPLPSDLRADTCLHPGRRTRGPSRWSIDVGVERDAKAAIRRARRFIKRWRRELGGGARAIVIPRYTGVDLFRAVITGVEQGRARDTCLAFRKQGGDCVIMDTRVAKAQLDHARRVARLNAAAGKRGKQ